MSSLQDFAWCSRCAERICVDDVYKHEDPAFCFEEAQRKMYSVYEGQGYSGDGYHWTVDDDCCSNTASSTDGELPDVADVLSTGATPGPGTVPQAPEATVPHNSVTEQDLLAQLRSGVGRFELLQRYCQSLAQNDVPVAEGQQPTYTPPCLDRAASLRTYLSQEWQQRYSVASFLMRRNPGYLQSKEESAGGGRLGLSLVGLPGSGKSTLMNVLAGEVVSPVSNSQGNADLKEATGRYCTQLEDSQRTAVSAEYRLRDIPGFLGTQEQDPEPSDLVSRFRCWLGLDVQPPTCASAMAINDDLARNYLKRYGVLCGRGGGQAAAGRADVVALVLNDRAKHLDVLLERLVDSGAVVVLVVTHSVTELALLEAGDVGAYGDTRAERLVGLLQGSMQAPDRLLATALSLPAFFVDTQHANTPQPHHLVRAAQQHQHQQQNPGGRAASAVGALIVDQLTRGWRRREMGSLREYLARGAVERVRLFRFVESKLEEKLRGFHEGRSWGSFLAEIVTNAAALGGGPLGPVAHSFLMSLLSLAGMMDAAGLLPPGSWQTRLGAHLKASVNWDSLEKASQTSLHNAFFAAVKGGLGLVGGAAWDFVDDLIGLAAREALTALVPFFGTALYALTLSYMRRRMAYAVAQKARVVHRRWIMENL